MPRFFRPKGGFQKSKAVLRIDDDGKNFMVQPDGTAKPHEYIGPGRVARPFWSIREVEKLIGNGKWEEVEPPKPPAQSTGPAVAMKPATTEVAPLAGEQAGTAGVEPVRRATQAKPAEPIASESKKPPAGSKDKT